MKKIKVTWNGEKLRDIYPHATKSQVRRWKFRRFISKVLFTIKWGFIGLTFLLLAFWFGGYAYSSEKILFQDREVKVDTLSGKIEQLKSQVLDDLKSCESGKVDESAGIIKFDSNSKASIGSYQFQVKTIQHYYKTLYNRDLTGKEAVLIALDDNKARELASDIIFNDSKGVENWYNCANKKLLRSKIDIINTLSK